MRRTRGFLFVSHDVFAHQHLSSNLRPESGMRTFIPASMIRRACAVTASTALLWLCLIGAGVAATGEDLSIDTQDGPRHALIFRTGDGPQPTVLVLHGATGTAAYTARASGFAEAAARRGLNAVFADGMTGSGTTAGSEDMAGPTMSRFCAHWSRASWPIASRSRTGSTWPAFPTAA